MERDLRRIVRVQFLRALAYGFGSVLLGTVLATGGLSDAEVGGVFTAMLLGMAVASVVVGRIGDRVGRRMLYGVLLLTMGGAGAVFALTRWTPALVLAALTGTLSTDPNESGPITSLEQAMIGQAPAATRIRTFGRYNAIAYLAGSIGSLAAAGPAALRHAWSSAPSNQRWLLAFPVIALACAAVARGLSPAMEASEPAQEHGKVPRRQRVRPSIRRLALLFALDAGAGGFVVQSFIVFWFHRRFGASTATMGAVFFGAGLLQAASSVAAARLGARIGLLQTMVFTHLPSNLLLAAVPFAGSLPLAIALLLARFALSQMDVPARQAYVSAMVPPQERTAAAAYTNTARYAVRPVGPAAAGALMQHVALSAPFAVAGGLKVVYDGLLYATFRKVPLAGDEETATTPGRPPPPVPG